MAAYNATVMAISAILLLVLSSASALTTVVSANSSPEPLAATPLTALQANWASANGNTLNQNYNPQNLINSSNVQHLGLSWLFPLPTHPTALLSVAGGLGVDTAPLIINGTVYATTQYGQVFALNAANGNVLWTDILPILPNSTAGQGAESLYLHLHDGAEQFTTKLFGGTPTYWISAPDHKVYAINAATGKYQLNFSYYGKGGVTEIAGNNPLSVYSASTSNIVIDQNRGVMVASMLSFSYASAARCFYRGWNLLVNPPQLMWTSYCTPPQPGSNLPVDPNWDVEQVNKMVGAWVFKGYGTNNPGGYGGPEGADNLKTLTPSTLNATLFNDWGYIQSPACNASDGGASPGATGAGWGSPWIVDEKTGLAYVNTGNKGPYDSACTPGPDLWAAAVMAINDTTGQWVWGFQVVPHDLWDWDCSWWQALGNETINGVSTEVLWKTCKSGYLVELNAATGALIWSWTPPTNFIARCEYCYMLDPLNATQMSYPFFNPSLQPTVMFPSAAAEFEAESAYSPTLNFLFLAGQDVPSFARYVPQNLTNYGKTAGVDFPALAAYLTTSDNTTVFAVNAATGQMVWSHFIATQGYRGGLSTSGNVVYLTLSSGDIQMLNAQTGALIKDLYIGGPLNVLPSIGATSSGQMEVIFPITAGVVTWGTSVPGDIVALTLPVPTTPVILCCTTSGPTVTTVTLTAVSTTTVGGGWTMTVSAAPTTVTTTAAPSGVSSAAVYGIAAVAVIFIISTGYLAMRGRKPAS